MFKIRLERPLKLCSSFWQNTAVELLAPLLRIREVPGPNRGHRTDCPQCLLDLLAFSIKCWHLASNQNHCHFSPYHFNLLFTHHPLVLHSKILACGEVCKNLTLKPIMTITGLFYQCHTRRHQWSKLNPAVSTHALDKSLLQFSVKVKCSRHRPGVTQRVCRGPTLP